MCFVQGLRLGSVGVSDDRRIFSRHGPVIGGAERDGGTKCCPDNMTRHFADHAAGALGRIDLFHNRGHRIVRYSWAARFYRAYSRAQHRDLLGDPLGSGIPDYGLASALGAIILVAALLLMWIYQRLTSHQERFATITGKGYRPRQVDLGHGRRGGIFLPWVYIFVAVVLPFAMLLWTSIQPFYAPSLGGFFAPRMSWKAT